MTFCIAFHSYKGGTGKTTIASNLSVHLAKQGNVVVLLDLDLYSPSLHTYFRTTPKKWINDFLYSSANINDILTEISFNLDDDVVLNGNNNNNSNNTRYEDRNSVKNLQMTNKKSNGKLFLGLANSSAKNFQQLDISGIENQKHFFHKLISLRDKIISKINPDYIILDTSPGIRYWSLNALAISDIFLLTLKMGDIDIKGTQIMIKEIYNTFRDSGTISFLLLNKVAGYCVPHTNTSLLKTDSKNNSFMEIDSLKYSDNSNMRNEYDPVYESKNQFDLDVISSIPCFCDIQFKQREYLTSYYFPIHPFSQKIELLAKKIGDELSLNM